MISQIAKEMTLKFAEKNPETKTTCNKMVTMFNIALKSGCDIEFA